MLFCFVAMNDIMIAVFSFCSSFVVTGLACNSALRLFDISIFEDCEEESPFKANPLIPELAGSSISSR